VRQREKQAQETSLPSETTKQPSTPTQLPSQPATNKQQPARKSGRDLISVQGGTFTMGCQEGRDKDCYPKEKPTHTVTLSAFQIGKYEVTQADWRDVMGSNPSNFKGCDDCPVENVSWDEVQDFIMTLNQRTGKKYRLPTEAEWEYAARGGHKMPKDVSMMSAYAGSDDISKVAWYLTNSGDKPHPVGLKTPNALGLYDMSGNVYEWCADWYGAYTEGAQSNPTGPKSGSLRVLRGGSWGSNAQFCRVAGRYDYTPEDRDDTLGFRLASSPQ
jgi:formylglycine-generating enzyme required for sulfatase activity